MRDLRDPTLLGSALLKRSSKKKQLADVYDSNVVVLRTVSAYTDPGSPGGSDSLLNDRGPATR